MPGNNVIATGQRAKRGESMLVVTLLLLVVLAFVETFRFRDIPWDPLGLAFWPRGLTATLAVCLIGRLWTLRWDFAQSVGGLRQAMMVFGLCCLYVVGFGTLGIYLATPPFFLLLMLMAPGRSKSHNAVMGLATAAILLIVIWAVFDQALGLRVISTPFWSH